MGGGSDGGFENRKALTVSGMPLTQVFRPANLQSLTSEYLLKPAGGSFSAERLEAGNGLKRKSGVNPVRSRHCNWRDVLPFAFVSVFDR